MTAWNNIVDGESGSSAFGKINTIGGVSYNGWIPATETWTFYSGDDPTYSFSTGSGTDMSSIYSAGMRVKCTVSGSVQQGIITAVSGSVVTAYWGTDYNLYSGSAITSPYFSMVKAPQGFPLDPTKWTISVTDSNANEQASPVTNTWYNSGSISLSVPIGMWNVSYQSVLEVYRTPADQLLGQMTLSTANNSESDVTMTSTINSQNANVDVFMSFYKSKYINLAAKTAYYLNIRTPAVATSIYIQGTYGGTIISAASAYL